MSRPIESRTGIRRERLCVGLLLALHLALVLWGITRNSVTFDENFHLPAGVMIVKRGDFSASLAQPPLVKVLCALPALAAGARVPALPPLPANAERDVGEAFMRANAARFHTLYMAARLPIAWLSLLLGLLVWRFARRLYGPRAALLSLALYALAPEALAHGGVVGMDLATGLGFTASIYAFWRFARGGAWAWWAATALAVGLSFLTRFSAAELAPILVILATLGTLSGRFRRPGRIWIGVALLPLTTLALVQLGYLGQTSMAPLSRWVFDSQSFTHLKALLPGLRLPLPDPCIAGLDYLAFLSQKGGTTTYLLGRGVPYAIWYYFPLALLFKWPLGFLAALIARVLYAAWAGVRTRRAFHEAFLLVPVLVMLAIAMFFTRLDVGIRYLFPILPLLCIACGGLIPHAARVKPGRRDALSRWALAAWLLAGAQAVETAAAAPFYLSFFNRIAAGTGHADFLINDSNVDWGQGLLALKSEMKRRGIAKIHLSYHGTTDPAIYGIDYVPYVGGPPGPESEWLAVSSFYFVGLAQRMTTQRGYSDRAIVVDFRGLWNVAPDARPAGCMYLFHLR